MQVTNGMGPTHLVALYVATAGQQGNALGTDEQEITLLVYVLIDALQNKVIGKQQYLVKPMMMEEDSNGNIGSDNSVVAGSTGVISEAALAHAPSITEDILKEKGIPLEKAVRQFDTWWSNQSYVPNGSHPRFVVDGQAPLRQCLHPEACNKSIDLPNYYTVFHDLRKEFSSCYSTTDELQPLSIQEMQQYFNLPTDSENDYHVKEIYDMVAVIQRMIKDGHVFQSPEVINMVLEPGICSKDEKVDNNSVVRARGLPWQSSDQDVARFFRGLNVAKGGVALCLSAQGRRNGEALVRFVNKEHRDMALKRHKHHIGPRYIEVYKAPGEDFIAVAGGTNSEAHAFLSRGAQVIVRMRGLPYDCTAKQVIEFFASGQKPCKVLDNEEGVLFVKKADGRATGDAFVLFAKEDDAGKALSKHRESIGSRYIELFRSTTAEVQQVLNRVSENKPYERPTLPLPPILTQHYITSGTRKDCIRLRGLPYEALVEHILEFLGEYAQNIQYKGVHMVYNAQGQPSGEAFIQMDSEASAHACASFRHHRYMVFGKKQRYIEVFQCSGEDMNLVLAGAPLPGKALLPSAGPISAHTPGASGALVQPPNGPVPMPAAQPPLWDIHALMQAQAVQAQAAHVAQAQQALRNQDLWLMALATGGPGAHVPAPSSPTSPNHVATSKTLALPAPQHSMPPYGVTAPPELHHPSQPGATGPLVFFNMPQRIPLMRGPPTGHHPSFMAGPPPILQQQINPAALLGLKRSWDSAFTPENSVPAKRPATHSWQTHPPTFPSGPPPGLAYPAQFFPQL